MSPSRSQLWHFCGLVSLVLAIPQPVAADEAADDLQDQYELMKVFVETFEEIEHNYVKDVDRRELMEAAIKGMLTKLDQYSSYIPPKDVSRFTESVEQEFGGIGIQVNIDPETKRLTVIAPLPGTPAYSTGVRAGDVIMEIESESTEGFSITDAIKRLRGRPGEAVTIGVLHDGDDTIEQIKIVRDTIQPATVMGEQYNDDGTWDFMLDDEKRIGYVRLTHFSRRSARELNDAIKELVSDDMQGLILDLRFNPGGLLSQAVEIADMFVTDGPIVSTKGRNTEERKWEAKAPRTYKDFPMAILVNRYSASASEIVSACLQDHERAVVVGERTFGKGSVQNVINLEDGASALKLTTASYHRPSGKNIHRFPDATEDDEWGVKPNDGYNIRFSINEMRRFREYRVEREAFRKGYVPKTRFNDRQREKAIEYLLSELTGAPVESNSSGRPEPDDASVGAGT